MQDVLIRAEQYQNLSMKKSQAHYDAAEMFSKRGIRLGIPVTVATAIVGTSIFATMSEQKSNMALATVLGALSIGAAILSALETFLRYSDRSGEHRRAGVAYESVRRSLDLFALHFRMSTDRAAALKALSDITKTLDTIAATEPVVPSPIYDSVKWNPASVADFSPSISTPPLSLETNSPLPVS
jgi:hypothetical protein